MTEPTTAVPPPSDIAPAEFGRLRRGLILATTVLGSSLAFIDGSVVNVALADMQRDLGASVGDLQWIANSYMLTLAALLLLGGAFGDRIGRRRIFILGLVIFAVTSVACAMAQNAPVLIIARAFQGVGAALLVPNSLAILSASYPRDKRGRAIGAWSAFAAVTSAGGPVLGGWLVDSFGWASVFWINPPIAALALVLALVAVEENRNPQARGDPDWLGGLLAMLGLGLVSYALIQAGEASFDSRIGIATGVLGILALALFVRVEARCSMPLMPLHLFADREFAAANVLTLLLYGALGAAVFLFPFGLIRLYGYTATESGAAFLPFALVLFLLARWGGTLIDRYGARMPLVAGTLITAVGLGMLAIPTTGTPYWSTFLPGVLVLGIGMAVSIPPLTTGVMNAVEDRHAGIASAVNNAASRVAFLIAVAAVGPLLLIAFNWLQAPLMAEIAMPEAVRAAIGRDPGSLASLTAPEGSGEAGPLIVAAAREALIDAFRIAIVGLAILATASGVVAAVMYPKKPRRTG
ncbi:MFS transporter [Thalassobaculum sp.]|uniref:MFS transporter n=1 Tax=Thalassobaculum sp. TaxID=2022740 RepID=UPI003B5CF835